MKALLSGGRGSGNRAASSTYYGTFVGVHGITTVDAESLWQGACPVAGTFSGFWASVTVNTRGASTYHFRVNGADGNQSISVGASTTGLFADSTNSDTVAAGDLIGYSLAIGAGGTSYQDHAVGVVFESSSGHKMLMGIHDAIAFSAASTTSPIAISGAPGTGQTESDVQLRFWKGGTLSDLYTNVGANTRADATTLRTRVNAANGNISISIPSSTTGVFSDTTNSDTLADDDLVNLQLVTGAGAGSITLRTTYIAFDSPGEFAYLHCTGQSLAVSAGLTRYTPVTYLSSQNATETLLRAAIGTADVRISNLRANIPANATTASSTIDLRVNQANSGVTLSVGAGATGLFTDTTNDVFTTAATDQLNYRVVAGTGGSITFRSLGLLVGHPRTVTAVLGSATAQGLVGDIPASGGTLSGLLASSTAVGLVSATPTLGALGVTGLLAAATAVGLAAATPTLGGLTTTALLAAATAAGLVGATPTLGSLTTTALLAAATAVGLVGATPTLGGLTTTALLAVATAAGFIGSLSSGSVLSGLLASATAVGLVGSVSLAALSVTALLGSATAAGLVGSSTVGALTVTALLGSATAQGLVAQAPSLGTANLTSLLASSTAQALVGTIQSGTILAGLLASAVAQGLLGTVTVAGTVTVTGLLAVANAVGLVGSFGLVSASSLTSRYERERVTAKASISKATASGFEALRRLAKATIQKG